MRWYKNRWPLGVQSW